MNSTMTHEQRLSLLNSAIRLMYGEEWTVTASHDASREKQWAVERRTKKTDVWIGYGSTLDDALAMASKNCIDSLHNHAATATRLASKLE